VVVGLAKAFVVFILVRGGRKRFNDRGCIDGCASKTERYLEQIEV
jgi:hypothetical protein